MTTPTRIDPVSWSDLCELALRLTPEDKRNDALLKIVRMIQKRENAALARGETP